MPTYEYKCPSCHITKEFLRTITDTQKVKCPECYTIMDKCFGGGSAIHFKGSGFYETDYKGK